VKWALYEPKGDIFAIQAALVLNQQLEKLIPDRSRVFRSMQALEQWYAAQTDVAPLFAEALQPPSVPPEKLSASLPAWLRSASAADQFAYHRHVIELADAQQQADGQSYLDGITDLHTFAANRLRERMLADHPVDANYQPDELA
jgi:hypothetical protein